MANVKKNAAPAAGSPASKKTVKSGKNGETINPTSVPNSAAKAEKVKNSAKIAVEDTSPAGYGDQSITSLKGSERVRRRPSIMFGSDGLDGCKHGFVEILSNAIDEANAGYGKEIRVTVNADHSMQVEDFGRGVPLGYNAKEGRYNWELVFCELFAGGKMDNNSDDSAYKYSLGVNGVGACATQYTSEYMNVDSFDGTNVNFIRFEKGEPVTELEHRVLSPSERRTGTVISWLPDLEVFTDINIPADYFRDIMHRQAAVNFGVKFVLNVENENGTYDEDVFYYPGSEGLNDYAKELAGGKTLTDPVFWEHSARGRDRDDKEEYPLLAQMSFCFTQADGIQEYYHNSSFLEHGGSPDRAVRSAFVSSIDKYLRQSGKYNKTEAKVTFNDIGDSLVIVISSHSTLASYENQTKKAITNTFIYESLNDFLRTQFDLYLIEHPIDAEKIANQILINKRSRENAEKARIDIKKKLTGTLDVANRVEKFVNCRSKDPEQRELYIVEGDSALTSCKLGRAAEFQAIIPVRGKTLNCMKSDYKQIFDSDIIVDLLRVIGCGVELDGKVKLKNDMAAFDYSALRWAKIIICTDADEDGFQIRTLLLTMFYRLLPTLIEKGKIFIAESPLFEITTKDQTYFAYNEVEKAEIMKELGDTKYTLQRSKGLGENEPEMMWKTTMNPATRRLIAVRPTDAYATEEMFDTLLGNNLPARKVFIAENSARYMKDADV
ncbi:MAG: toprim domain-containing protein [Clostridia bacterium]|nr:toprim domain-containing protein [Clostridia bacterium]